mgnify:CR=1 FL=1
MANRNIGVLTYLYSQSTTNAAANRISQATLAVLVLYHFVLFMIQFSVTSCHPTRQLATAVLTRFQRDTRSATWTRTIAPIIMQKDGLQILCRKTNIANRPPHTPPTADKHHKCHSATRRRLVTAACLSRPNIRNVRLPKIAYQAHIFLHHQALTSICTIFSAYRA